MALEKAALMPLYSAPIPPVRTIALPTAMVDGVAQVLSICLTLMVSSGCVKQFAVQQPTDAQPKSTYALDIPDVATIVK